MYLCSSIYITNPICKKQVFDILFCLCTIYLNICKYIIIKLVFLIISLSSKLPRELKTNQTARQLLLIYEAYPESNNNNGLRRRNKDMLMFQRCPIHL